MRGQSKRLFPHTLIAALLPFVGQFVNVLRNSKQIREEIGELFDRAQAIFDVAESEKRELTAEEKAEIDAIQGSGKKGEAGYKPGKIDALETDLARVEKYEARQAELAASRVSGAASGRVPAQQGDADGDEGLQNRRPRIVIPAANRFRFGKFKAFKALPLVQAEEHAYIAGRFYAAALFGHETSRTWCREHGVDLTFRGAMKESSNETGGFLVPVEVEQAIIDLRQEYGVFRRSARNTPMASDTKNLPRRKTGLTAYFAGENSSVTESDKSWDNVQLVAKKLMTLTRYSSELSEDAMISIGDDLTNEIAYAFAVKEDQCGFVGDGTSTYGGIVGVVNAVAAGSVVDAASGNTGFETLDLTDFEACVGRLPQYPGIQPAWYISKAGWAASMLRLLDAAGGNTAAMLSAGEGGLEFLGAPVVITQVLNATLGADASKPKAIYGDLNMGATLGNRRGISVMLSDQRYFEYDQLGIRGSERFDIVVHSRGTSTAGDAGALVVLKTPAS